MLLARVALGEPHYVTTATRGRVAPAHPHGGRYDSIVANIGISNGQASGRQEHREFIIFDGKQAYPEMLIYYSI